MKWYHLLLLFWGTINAQQQEVHGVLDRWHKDAAEARFDSYFDAFAADGRYLGTDATENWSVDEFKKFAKPFFDRGRAWDFKPIQRYVYFSADKTMAWFDEVLDTWMGLCRNSGVMRKENGKWKIVHCVLSQTVPNEVTKQVNAIKKELEDQQKQNLPNKR